MNFNARFSKLNKSQENAVNSIFGPLLVIAGPGTGKTELLSMRAANILKETDTLPSNILCLTFTDSGSFNMQERLRQIIGQDAYKVAIHTFHSFGTEVISKNREFFFNGADRQPADDIIQRQILKSIFDNLKWDNPLATTNNGDFIYLGQVMTMISEFKKSGLRSDELKDIIHKNKLTLDEIAPEIAETFTGRISKATIEKFATLATKSAKLAPQKMPTGINDYAKLLTLSIANASKDAIDSDSTKPVTAWRNEWCKKDAHGNFVLKDSLETEKLLAAIDIYDEYTEALNQQNLFDYDDMILSVLEACRKNPELTANLREQYQFIMVDEFQDTNLAQLRLLFELTGEGKDANVMAVGDDDQAIYSFQGANNDNIQRFREQFNDPKIIVLTENYRSSPDILDASREVILQGEDRLENTIEDLSKELSPNVDNTHAKVKFNQYESPIDERDGVAEQISQLINQGTKPEDIAVLAKQHNKLIELLPYLNRRNIAVNYEKRDNVFDHEIIKSLELISRVILAISKNNLDEANALIPELISHPALNFETGDIWKLSLHARRSRQLWLESMLANSKFEEFANWLLERARDASNKISLELQIDNLTAKFSNYYFSEENLAKNSDAYLSALESLRTFRNSLINHFENPTLKNMIEFIDIYKTLDAQLVTIRRHADNEKGAIHLMSSHKAKGLEFPHVFIIDASDASWGEKARGRSRQISYPANLQLQPTGANYDERIRLFFVAMTRAKTTLHMSYSKSTETGKSVMPASFLSSHPINEIASSDSTEKNIELLEIDWRARLARPISTDLRSTLTPVLENYKLSATHLNNFLDITNGGPTNFLLTNLLQFPQAKSSNAEYGTAIHSVLQFAHNSVLVDKKLPPVSELVEYFTQNLQEKNLPDEDFATFQEKGELALQAFFEAKGADFTDSQRAELNFSSQGVVVNEARLTGKIDLIDINKSDKTISVTDYKTGKGSGSWKGSGDYEKIKLHKYRQQLMFYQLLIENSRDYSGYKFSGGVLQFVEPDKNTGEILSLTEAFSKEELDEFTQLISIVWQKIINLDLPDTSGYDQSYKGVLKFEEDLIAEAT